MWMNHHNRVDVTSDTRVHGEVITVTSSSAHSAESPPSPDLLHGSCREPPSKYIQDPNRKALFKLVFDETPLF
ncbi:hypothetical protein EYF80_042463 [Liparis tanakae]|uniref:Uncharacterized protein n=1 Tax=Liparis tanakae TaxID=230148 RepID=A0A4Z2G1A5_9TELE|nr:hypothetical protein EYF80_042463 [Liparis tanakae]